MTALNLSYRQIRHEPFKFTRNTEIAAVAAEVRKQLGAANRLAITLDDLKAIDKLSVNGLSYDLWVDMDRPVHDDDGNEILGVFEFAPLSSTEAVSISVSPANTQVGPQLVLSTAAHELGHAIYDGPGLIAGYRTRSLFDHGDSRPVQAFRLATDAQDHLHRQAGTMPEHILRSERRANEFMGSLLVPRDLLWQVIQEEAPKYALEIRYEETLFAASPDGNKELVWTEATYDIDTWTFTRALAPHFGVNPAFIEIRMKRYGIMPSDTRPN